MGDTAESQEKTLLQSLRRQIKKEQFTKAIETCEKLLAINPDDADIYKVRVVCFINLKDFDSALDSIGGREDLHFEQAYCLYRKNDLEGALRVCDAIPDPKPDKVLNLHAQTCYKLHRYAEAASCYEDLTAATDDGDTDLLTNYYAAQVSDGKAGTALRAKPLDAEEVGDSFDLLFNVACAYISAGRISRAESTLQAALDLCRRVLTGDGLSQEEVTRETTGIAMQKTFVDILLGRATQRSLEECREVLKSYKKSDELLAVAANNLAVLRGDKDLPDSLRRLRSTISSASEERLTRSQLMDLKYNRCILLLHMKKVEECGRALDELDQMYGVTARSVIIRASIIAANGDYEGCDKLLQQEILRLGETEGGSETAGASAMEKLSVVRAQACIHRGLYAQAEEILSSLQGVYNTTAGISAMYQLKLVQSVQNQTRTAATDKLETQLVDHLLDSARRLASADTDSTEDAIRVAALFQIARELHTHQNYEAAANVLQLLLSCADAIDSEQRLTATSLLAAALSRCDVEGAARIALALPQVDYSDVSAAELERSEIPRLFKRLRPTGVDEDTALATESGDKSTSEQRAARSEAVRRARTERKRARRRELYLQKLQEAGKYDPARPIKPDPERWLPLKHRSYSKRGRKNRSKFVGGQGSGDGAHKDMHKLDAYARAQAAAENPTKKSGVVIEAAGGSGNKKKNRKKK